MKPKRILRRYRFSASGICLGYTEHNNTPAEYVKSLLLGITVVATIMFCGYKVATTNIPNLNTNPSEISILSR